MIEKITTGSFFTNSYIISNDYKECIIVDPGLSYRNAYEQIIAKYKPKAILITHGHVDHIDGISFFKDLPVYISSMDEKMMYDSTNSLYLMINKITPFKNGELNVINVSDGDIISLIGFSFRVISTPGHTKGSLCYLMDNNLFSGDTLFHLSSGRCDFPTGNSKEMNDSLKKLKVMISDDTMIYPGHDDITRMDVEKKYNPYLQ